MTIHTLKFAGAPQADASASTSGSSTSPSYANGTSYSLLELPTELLDLLRDPSRSSSSEPVVELRGRADDEAVLVTADRTYALRSIQNSNSVMIVNATAGATPTTDAASVHNSEEGCSLEIIYTVGETIEASEVTKVPGDRFQRLEDVLEGTEYWGVDDEQERQSGTMPPLSITAQSDTNSQNGAQQLRSLKHQRGINPAQIPETVLFSHLTEHIRASDAEIHAALDRLHVVELKNGCLRKLPSTVLSKVLSGFLVGFDATGLSHEHFECSALVASVVEDGIVSADIAEAVLNWYTTSTNTATSTVSLDIKRLISDLGKTLLLEKPIGKPHDLQDFVGTWQAATGGSSSTYAQLCNPALLATDSLLSSSQGVPMIIPFPQSHLSPDAPKRIRQLFSARPKWRTEELNPFLEALVGGAGKKVDGLILKYCRKIKEKERVKAAEGKGKEEKDVTYLVARNNW